MVRESQTVFLIERMQPHWLRDRLQKWSYNLGDSFFIGTLAAGGGAWLIFDAIFDRAQYLREFDSVSSLRFSWRANFYAG